MTGGWRRGLAPLPAVLALACGVLAPWQAAQAQARLQPAPPASRPTVYDPDASTCQPEQIRSSFARQLQPFADQSEAVLARLRQVQVEMTAATLRRCVARGLLTAEQASQLATELRLAPAPAQPGASTRP